MVAGVYHVNAMATTFIDQSGSRISWCMSRLILGDLTNNPQKYMISVCKMKLACRFALMPGSWCRWHCAQGQWWAISQSSSQPYWWAGPVETTWSAQPAYSWISLMCSVNPTNLWADNTTIRVTDWELKEFLIACQLASLTNCLPHVIQNREKGKLFSASWSHHIW